MARLPLNKVRWLTLREIAKVWAREADLPEPIMLRELRYAAINIPRLKDGLEPLAHPLPEHELPDPDQQVDRDWLIDFCGKQGWSFPDFWKGEIGANRQFPGRPGYAHRIAIERELDRRGNEGLLQNTLADEARSLRDWAAKEFPNDVPPSARTIENACRAEYRALKAAHENK